MNKFIIPFAMLAIASASAQAAAPVTVIMNYTSKSSVRTPITGTPTQDFVVDNAIFTETVGNTEYTYKESSSLTHTPVTYSIGLSAKATTWYSNGTKSETTTLTETNRYSVVNDTVSDSRTLLSTRQLSADEIAQVSAIKTPEFNLSTGLSQIHADAAYLQGYTGAGVTVAVVDTGFSSKQVADKPINMLTGYNVRTLDSNVQDVVGHGTHVTGIIAAAKNGTGVQGIAYNATIMPIKAVDNSDKTPMPEIAKGVEYAYLNGAKVINMSISSYQTYDKVNPNLAQFNTDFGDAYLKAVQNGTSIVVAAGNLGATCTMMIMKYDYSKYNPIASETVSCGFPAALPVVSGYESLTKSKGGFIAVGAVDSKNVIASYSNKAGATKEWFIVAPGTGIKSTASGGGLVSMTGTSMAAPYVSGAMALLAEKFPYLDGATHAKILFMTATDLGTPGIDAVYGHGLLNLERAMQPIGQLKIKQNNTDTPIASITTTPVVAASIAKTASLKNTVVTDDFNRGYSVNMTNAIKSGQMFSFDNLKFTSLGKLLLGTVDGKDTVGAFGFKITDNTTIMAATNVSQYSNQPGTFFRLNTQKQIENKTFGANVDFGRAYNSTSGLLVNSVTDSTMLGGGAWMKTQLDGNNAYTVGFRIPMVALTGKASITAPTSIDNQGNLYYTNETVSLRNKVTQFNAYATYDHKIDSTQKVSLTGTAYHFTELGKTVPIVSVTYNISF